MTSEELSFYRCIWESPQDDAPRLVFADWLEEHDRGKTAELIRLDCELNRLQDTKTNAKRRHFIAMTFLRSKSRYVGIALPIPPMCVPWIDSKFIPWTYTPPLGSLETYEYARSVGIEIPEQWVREEFGLSTPTSPDLD